MEAKKKSLGSPDEINALWCLYHKKLALQLDGLRINEARAILHSWDRSDWDQWLCWMEGWPQWEAAKHAKPMNKAPLRKAIQPPPVLPGVGGDGMDDFVIMKEGKEFREEDFGVTAISLRDLPQVLEKDFVVRNHRRFAKRMLARVDMAGRVFQTYTVDVSAGGVLLEAAMPEWVTGHLRVFLRKENSKEEVRIHASFVEDQERRRLALEGLSDEDQKRLLVWLGS